MKTFYADLGAHDHKSIIGKGSNVALTTYLRTLKMGIKITGTIENGLLVLKVYEVNVQTKATQLIHTIKTN